MKRHSYHKKRYENEWHNFGIFPTENAIKRVEKKQKVLTREVWAGSEKRFTNQAQTFAKMKENGKKSTKVATKKSTKVASKEFYFMNVKFEGNESIIRMGETRDVRLKYVDEDNFLATEKAKRVVNGKSQARTTLARTVHGTMSKDDYGFHIGFYIRRDEVRKNAELADILEAEAEEMGNRIVEMEAICN